MTHDGDLLFRQAVPGDLHGIAKLRFQWRSERGEHGLAEPEFEAALREWLDRHRGSHLPFVALRGRTPIGMAWLVIVDRIPGPGRFTRRSGDIQSVYVAPPERGHGVGSRLTSCVVDAARRMELGHLSLHPSERAVPMYRRLGFEGSDRLLGLHLS